jgi:uncharacterized protein (DUF427 family)
MSLTLGSGPFAKPQHAGECFNFPVDAPGHILYFGDSPKRIRVVFGSEIIADSQHAKMLHETGHLPVYYLPEEDVRTDLLNATDHHTHCPFKGEASYWSVQVNGREAENAVWRYPHSIEEAPPLDDYFAFEWDAMDAWFEEDEPVGTHPRDPYHRVDVRESTRHITIEAGGEVIVETSRPMLLFETGLPTRYYIPRADVNNDLLIASVKQTACPYKGHARYWSVKTDSGVIADIAWCYEQPLPEAWKVGGYVCFPQEAEEVEMEIEE